MIIEATVILFPIGTLCIAIGFFYKSKILLLIGHLVIGSHLILLFLYGLRHWEFAIGIILFILAGFVYQRAHPWRAFLWFVMAAPLGIIYYLCLFILILYNLFADHGWLDQLWRFAFSKEEILLEGNP